MDDKSQCRELIQAEMREHEEPQRVSRAEAQRFNRIGPCGWAVKPEVAERLSARIQ
ncbi:hypothetical protein ACIP10_34730 [Streptomyces galbus]|uniref:hypothetical protein n=1 Tax=Streptomyces galbus TaxID=33898 RepID=UPI003814DC7D